MNNLTQTEIPNVFVVKVPLGWTDFEIANGSNMIIFKINDGFDNEIAGQTINLGHFNTFKNDFKILGTITKSEISFDASEVVEKKFKVQNEIFYKDYTNTTDCFKQAEQSFRSALPKEIVFDSETKYLILNKS